MDKMISEIFCNYEVRKTTKQKSEFIKYTHQKAIDEGYTVNLENGFMGSRNIVVGDPERAKVVFTAHYDTCPRLPFPNLLTPKNFGLYLLYNIMIVFAILSAVVAVGLGISLLGIALNYSPAYGVIIGYFAFFAFFGMLIFGPANKHTANDNTSGVTVLFGIMQSLPAELRDVAAFVFFDQEEMGLYGSSSFARAHKNVKKNTLLINFDCVSDGNEIMLVPRKGAKQYKELLERVFENNGDLNVQIDGKAFYPSDQIHFKRGVGVAAFNKTKHGILYLNKIHTKKDTVSRRENIDFLVSSSVKLAETVKIKTI